MGYYTGSGVVTAKSQVCQSKERIIWYGTHDIIQEKTIVVTVKNGVELPSSISGSAFSMSDQKWYNSSATASYFISPSCKGSQTSVAYSRIGDSNLYTLTTTTETCRVQATGLQSGWTPSGWQS